MSVVIEKQLYSHERVFNMAYIIAISNQKGGVAKTTTAEHLGIGLAEKGFRVLLIDADPQGSLTTSLGCRYPDELEMSLANILQSIMDDIDLDPMGCIIHHEEGIDLLPGNISLAVVEANMATAICRELILKTCIARISDNYDYIIIDCMPSLGILTTNALACADSVLIPLQAAYLPVKGLQQLISTIGIVQKRLNRDLKIEGILITATDLRTNIAKDIVSLLRSNYGERIRIFRITIPNTCKFSESSAEGVSIYRYAPQHKASLAYAALVEEVLDNEK